jgi:F-type H+-transporting ATPase subunit epsilon
LFFDKNTERLMMPIRCEIVSQDRMVYEGDIDIMIAPGELGEMGILPNHAPLLSSLQFGIITIRTQDREEHFTIAGGILEVQPKIITVLADAAENVKEIDVSRAEAARRQAQAMLAKGPPPDTDAYLKMEAALKRSTLRLEAARRYGRAQKPGRYSSSSDPSSEKRD